MPIANTLRRCSSVRTRWLRLLLLPVATGLVFSSSVAIAGSVLLNWAAPTQNADGSPLTDLAGYRVYSGCSASGQYERPPVSIGQQTAYTLNGLPDAGACYFVVSAINAEGGEGAPSNEAQKLMGVLEEPGEPGLSIEWVEHAEPAVTLARVGGVGLEQAPGAGGNLAWPGGLSSDHIAVLLVSWYEGGDGGGEAANETFNTPAGFTLQGTSVVISGAGSQESRVAIYTKELAGSESGNLAVSPSGSTYYNVIMDVYSGDGDLTIASVTAGTPATGTTATAPSVSGTSGQGLVAGYGTSDPTTMTTPTDMTAGEVGGQNTNTGRLFYQTLASTGATGTRTSTLGTSRGSVGFSILIDDAGGGGEDPSILPLVARGLSGMGDTSIIR